MTYYGAKSFLLALTKSLWKSEFNLIKANFLHTFGTRFHWNTSGRLSALVLEWGVKQQKLLVERCHDR